MLCLFNCTHILEHLHNVPQGLSLQSAVTADVQQAIAAMDLHASIFGSTHTHTHTHTHSENNGWLIGWLAGWLVKRTVRTKLGP